MYKLVSSAKNTDDLSIGFDRDRDRRQRELTINKNQKDNNHIRNDLKDKFGLPEHQAKVMYSWGDQLTIKRNGDNAVLKKDNAINIAKFKSFGFEWSVPHYIGIILQQAILTKQILSKTPTELQYVERSVFMKEVSTQDIWNFELGY